MAGGCGTDDGSEDQGKPCDPATCVDPFKGEETGAVARYDLTAEAADWHATPFPTDTRRRADGTLDLSGFPQPRLDGALKGELPDMLKSYMGLAETVLDGFGIAPTVYVQFDRALAPDQLPSIQESVGEDFFCLVDVQPDSPEYGRHIPLRWRLSGAERGQMLWPHLLMVQPTWGVPLRPKTTYAFVMKRSVRDTDNRVLAQPPALKKVIDHAFGVSDAALDAPHQTLHTSLVPLFAAMKAGKIGLHPQAVAAATVFTTGTPAAELKTIAAWIRTHTERKPAYGWKPWDARKTFKLVPGLYEGPNFQQGQPPYSVEGGGFVFDAQGNPVVQATEKALRVAIAVPNNRDLEVGGLLPVVIYSHGTGGSFDSFAGYNVIEQLCASGLAVVGIDQPLHGPRGGTPPLSEAALAQASFNFFNPASGRSVFRQGVLDNVFLIEMIREGKLDIPDDMGPGKGVVRLDPNRMHFFGHSQGGLVGPMLATVEPNIRAFVLSGTGGGLSLTAMLRKDPVSFEAIIVGALKLDKGELSEFHPAMSLIQMLVDITDPLAYGRHVFERTPEQTPPHILMSEGLKDTKTPSATAEALAAAMGLAIRYPSVHKNEAMEAIGTLVIAPPFNNNLLVGGSKTTGALVQYPDGGHGAIFGKDGTALSHDFLFKVATEGVPWVK